MLKKCCFNCRYCFSHSKDEFVCKINGVAKKYMNIKQSEKGKCKAYIQLDDMADPYD